MAQNYTLLSETDVQELLQLFPIEAPLHSCSAMSGGFANSNFRLEFKHANSSNTLLCLKVCDEKSVAQLEEQISCLVLLETLQFPTCYPHVARDNKRLVVWRGKPCLLLDFVSGAPGELSRIDQVDDALPQRELTMLASLGSTVAALHLAPTPPDFATPFAMGRDEMTPFLNACAAEQKWNKHSFVKELTTELRRLQPILDDSRWQRSMVHGDAFLDNALFDETSGKLNALIDFEEVCLDACVLDVAMCLVGCCFRQRKQTQQSHWNTDANSETFSLALAKRFLQAYNAQRPLSALELQHLVDWTDYACYSIAFWRFRQYNVRHPSSPTERRNSYQQMLLRRDKLRAIKSELISCL